MRAQIIMGKEKLIPFAALILLLVGCASSIYVYAIESDADSITIQDKVYNIDQIFLIAEKREFKSLNYTGVALDDLVIKAGVGCPSCHKYTIVGSDRYQQTVTWEDMQNGLLTKDKMVVFPDLRKAFWVNNVVKIEVI